MTKDSGALSIDFIAGFAIFMIAFVWVISLVPGILVGLQAYTIDYDAVAYRTGVILVEDPGETTLADKTTPWEDQSVKGQIARFGLATSRDTPNILSQDKINKFFNKTFFTIPGDYRTKAIFGDYPYKFNISLHDVERDEKLSVDTSPLPEGYGYSRRLVKIKSGSNATINSAIISKYDYVNNESASDPNSEFIACESCWINATTHMFSILVDTPMLFKQETDPVYRIDPLKEPIMINISDLSDRKIRSNQNAKINLTKILINDDPRAGPIELSVDGSYAERPVEVTNSVEVANYINITISQEYFQSYYYGISNSEDYIPVRIDLTFDVVEGGKSTFLNNTWSNATFTSSPFLYDHNPENVTQPHLRDAVVEVAVW